mgnify:FL=1
MADPFANIDFEVVEEEPSSVADPFADVNFEVVDPVEPNLDAFMQDIPGFAEGDEVYAEKELEDRALAVLRSQTEAYCLQ